MDKAIEAVKSWERMQKAVFDAAQEPVEQEPAFIPYGRCSRHLVTISNGMFDTPCPLCEAANDNEEHQTRTTMPVDASGNTPSDFRLRLMNEDSAASPDCPSQA